jgi:hypothetical protein
MIEPNRLSSPGERAALARVEAIVERIDGLRIEMLALSQDALLDPEEHARLMGQVEAEAERCGRRELLHDVLDRVRTALHARLAEPTRFDPIGRYPLTPTRAEDAAAIVMTATDAVAVAVMEDRISTDTAARLSAPGRMLLGLPPLGDQRLPPAGGDAGVPEPSAEDWAAASAGDLWVGDHTPVPVGLRIALATAAACILGPAALVVGVAVGQTGAGILAGLAVVAVCWLAATYRH